MSRLAKVLPRAGVYFMVPPHGWDIPAGFLWPLLTISWAIFRRFFLFDALFFVRLRPPRVTLEAQGLACALYLYPGLTVMAIFGLILAG